MFLTPKHFTRVLCLAAFGLTAPLAAAEIGFALKIGQSNYWVWPAGLFKTTALHQQAADYPLGTEYRQAVAALPGTEVHFKALAENPYAWESHAHLAQIAAEKGYYAGGLYHAVNALKYGQQSGEQQLVLTSYYYRALCLDQLGAKDEAFELYRQYTQINPGDWRTFYRLGIYYRLKGNQAQAEQMFSESRLLKAKGEEDTSPAPAAKEEDFDDFE